MNILVRDKAYEDIERVYAWIAKDNVRAARLAVESIFEAAEHLAEFPELGREGTVRNTREWIVRGLPYIIVYRVRADDLIIDAVFHAAQNR